MQLTPRASSWALSPISKQPFVFKFYFVRNVEKKLVHHPNIRSIYFDELNLKKEKEKKGDYVAIRIQWSAKFQCSDSII